MLSLNKVYLFIYVFVLNVITESKKKLSIGHSILVARGAENKDAEWPQPSEFSTCYFSIHFNGLLCILFPH